MKVHQAAIAQAVERRIGNAEVTGPTPVSSFHISVWSANLEIRFALFFITFVICIHTEKYLKNVYNNVKIIASIVLMSRYSYANREICL